MKKVRFHVGDTVYGIECDHSTKASQVECRMCNGAKKVGGVSRNKLVSKTYTRCPACCGRGTRPVYRSNWVAEKAGKVTAIKGEFTRTAKRTTEYIYELQIGRGKHANWYDQHSSYLFPTMEAAQKAAKKKNGEC